QCQNLLASGLLDLTDFHFATTKKGGGIQRKEIPLSEINYDISLEGVRYAIGKKALGLPLLKGVSAKNITVALLEKGKAGIIANNQGYKEVKYIIHLLDEEEKNKKRQEIIDEKKIPDGFKVTMYTILDKQETLDRIYPWDITQENPKRKEESSEDYAKRLQTIKSYDFIQKITDDFSAKTGIGIHNLTWREQQWLAAAAYDLGFSGEMERLYSFANNYKLDGLKAFLSCEFDLQDSKKILNIGEEIPAKDAAMIFEKTAEIIDLAEKESTEIGKTLLKNANFDLGSSLKLQFLKEARSIITKFSENAGSGTDKDKLAELIDDLRLKRSEITILSSLLKSLKESGQEIDFEMIRDLDLDISGFGEKLEETDARKVIAMTRENWQQVPALAEAYAGNQLESDLLENSDQFECYALRYQREIVAFMKFKKLAEGELFASSFGVSKDLHGLKIGTEMLEKIIWEKAEENIIHATTSPRIAVGTAYVEKIGFVIDGFDDDFQHTGEPAISITIDRKSNKGYHQRDENKDFAKQKDYPRIISGADSLENLDGLIGNRTIILRFDMRNGFDRFRLAMKKLLPKKGVNDPGRDVVTKYIATRYFQNKKEAGDIRYLVYEKIPQE
ncbi:MAG: hypothetical protein ACD_15C00188G0001, partial [uncultured bacterium]